MVTYFTATNGNDTTGNGSQGNPYRTIIKGMSILTPGDILYIRGGTYDEIITGTSSFTIPSGISWNSPITISGFQSEVVTLINSINIQDNVNNSTPSYLIFDSLTQRNAQPSNGFRVGGNSHHIRLSNSDFAGAQSLNQGSTIIQFTSTTSYTEVINCLIHDALVGTFLSQTTGSYGFYINGNHMLIEGNRIYNCTGYAIHLFLSGGTTVSDNIIRNNIIYNNSTNDGTRNESNGAVTIQSGNNNRFYNNIVYNNGANGHSGSVQTFTFNDPTLIKDMYILNNTIYNNAVAGVEYGVAGSPATNNNTVIKNNIVYNNGDGTTPNQIRLAPGFNTTFPDISNNITSNPSFTNSNNADFTLTLSSNAIDSGIDLSSLMPAVDILGLTRPAGFNWDSGAYEFSSSITTYASIWWDLEELSGNTVFDKTGLGNNGTLINSPLRITTLSGKGLQFNGLSNYVSASMFAWAANQPVTVLFWVNTPGGVNAAAFSIGDASLGRFSAHVPWGDNMLYWDYGTGFPSGRISLNFTPYLNTWHHIALVSEGVNNGFMGIYIDGNLITSNFNAVSLTSIVSNLLVGSGTLSPNTYFHQGNLDDFQIYNVRLSQQNILALAHQDSPLRGNFVPPMRALIHF